jgi:adenosylhomocysteinase
VYLLAEGRLVNLAAGGRVRTPSEIMDMSFALQALTAEYMAKHGKVPRKEGLDPLPPEIDETRSRA